MKIFLFAFFALAAAAQALAPQELDRIGRRVWRNECGGTREGLTSWNEGEDFASLGIGHFIWYPAGPKGPFEESFPRLVRFLEARGVKLPAGLDGACPWRTRADFQTRFKSAELNELRELLARTISLQAEFLTQRMDEALPKMEAAAPSQRAKVRAQFRRVAASEGGTFALIDYVNFKGEGTKPEERYGGQGWGLLQVLAGMRGEGPATADFARSAVAVLARRVANSPPERHEARWLAGWTSRVRAYAN